MTCRWNANPANVSHLKFCENCGNAVLAPCTTIKDFDECAVRAKNPPLNGTPTFRVVFENNIYFVPLDVKAVRTRLATGEQGHLRVAK